MVSAPLPNTTRSACSGKSIPTSCGPPNRSSRCASSSSAAGPDGGVLLVRLLLPPEAVVATPYDYAANPISNGCVPGASGQATAGWRMSPRSVRPRTFGEINLAENPPSCTTRPKSRSGLPALRLRVRGTGQVQESYYGIPGSSTDGDDSMRGPASEGPVRLGDFFPGWTTTPWSTPLSDGTLAARGASPGGSWVFPNSPRRRRPSRLAVTRRHRGGRRFLPAFQG